MFMVESLDTTLSVYLSVRPLTDKLVLIIVGFLVFMREFII